MKPITSVLIVDDKEENLYYLSVLLSGNGFTVDSARHGAEALVKARQHPPDVVVSDLLMPVMDGYTLLRHWKADARLKTIPFIVYTATYTEAEDERLALNLGADAFILKPAEPEDFLARLREVQGAGEASAPPVPKTPVGDEGAILQTYSETLIRKLEEKTLQLQEANAALEKDIAERKKIEAALRESNERFRLLSKATNDAIWDWNIATGEIWRNEGFETLFGYRPDEIEKNLEEWKRLLHPDSRDQVVASIQRVVAGSGEKWEAEYRFRRSDGTYADVLDRGYVIRDADGRAVRMIGGMTDQTERKKLEYQFLRAQRMESIGTLAGGIAHDLNNVLSPIMMSLEVLGMRFKDKESQDMIAVLSSSAQRGADMIRQVLSFARGIEGRRMVVQVRHIIRDIEKIACDTFLKQIKVRTVVPNDLWPVAGDPTQLHQVLMNLCVNARDAMPGGGTLAISAENLTLDRHYAGMNLEAKAGPYVVLHVEDSGNGVPPEIAEKIFDPFFTTKEVGKGTGLGLSTSLAIVKSHGGFIRVYSEPGKGSTFRVYLPALTEDPSVEAADASAALPRGNGELILVVDDEASVRQITQQTLEAFGYRVFTANDGADAVATYVQRRGEIAVVLTDMMMPVMDGPATISVLRRMNPDVRIIAASGLSAGGQSAQAAHLGVKQFLPKPYTAETLLKTLKETLSAP